MSHFVIDSRARKRYILLFVVSVLVSFVLGYWLGSYQQSGSSVTSYEELKSQVLPGKEANSLQAEPAADKENTEASGKQADNKPADKKTTEKKSASKKTTQNKTADNKANSKTTSSKSVASNSKPVKKPTTKKVAEKKTTSPTKPDATKKLAAKSTETQKTTASKAETTPVNQTQASDTTATASQPSTEVKTPNDKTAEKSASTTDAATSSQTMYSVQVGMFASQENAQKLVNELQGKGFDAYMKDFISSSGETKYNVRFGNYPERTAVREKLAEYKQLFTTPAYIVINK